MKRIKIHLFLLLFVSWSINVAIAQENTSKAKVHLASQKPTKTSSFTFPAAKVVEVALFSISPGKEKMVGEDYFPKVFPIAQEYGLSGAQTFTVVETKFGEAPVQQLGFFIWDSYEQKEAFDRDPRYLELRNIRNKAFDFLYMGYFSVEKDITYTFDSESYYDFAALWIDPANASKLKAYFDQVAPVAMNSEYGYQPIASLAPLNDCTRGKYTPDKIGFAKWGDKDSFSRLMKHKTYKKYVHLRDEATPYKDVFVVKANIQ